MVQHHDYIIHRDVNSNQRLQPNLYEYYPDAKLSDCLIETSYAKPTTPRRYQSFYAKLENVLNVLVANLPHATKS